VLVYDFNQVFNLTLCHSHCVPDNGRWCGCAGLEAQSWSAHPRGERSESSGRNTPGTHTQSHTHTHTLSPLQGAGHY